VRARRFAPGGQPLAARTPARRSAVTSAGWVNTHLVRREKLVVHALRFRLC
jgi:hypothetical protein